MCDRAGERLPALQGPEHVLILVSLDAYHYYAKLEGGAGIDSYQFDAVFVDEAVGLRSEDSRFREAVDDMRDGGARIVVMTGTPVASTLTATASLLSHYIDLDTQL